MENINNAGTGNKGALLKQRATKNNVMYGVNSKARKRTKGLNFSFKSVV